MKIITPPAQDIGSHSLCGYKCGTNPSYLSKKQWLESGYQSGLRHALLVTDNDKAIGGIEFAPEAAAWRPVKAPGFYCIHCIYIMKKEAKGQGWGERLLKHAIEEIKVAGAQGVVTVIRKGSWMAGQALYEKFGFVEVDSAAPDFKLLSLPFQEGLPTPSFSNALKQPPQTRPQGLVLYWSKQCPYLTKSVPEILSFAAEHGIPVQEVKIETRADLLQSPCAYGVFCLTLNGDVVAVNPISKTRFSNIARSAGLFT